MKGYLDQSPIEVMKKHGKSFFFASQVFTEEQLQKVAELYRLCRYIDDLADEHEPNFALEKLGELKEQITKNELKGINATIVIPVLSSGVERSALIELIDGALFDLSEKEILSLQDLLIYCYQVAGVVGLMMCPILNINDKKARRYSIDLGIGMQLTNISRDILEDALNDRCYIPSSILKENGIEKQYLKRQDMTNKELKAVVKFLLNIADKYYESSRRGFSFIPLRARFAILFASEIYRAIGKKIAKNNYDVLQGRVYLTKVEKVLVSMKSLRFAFSASFWTDYPHKSNLHQLINHMPGTNRG